MSTNSPIQTCFRLSGEERKAILKADPKPQIPETSPPYVDEYLGVIWKGKLNPSQDREWKRVLLCATGPLCGLWSQIHEQELDSEDGPIPASPILDIIQCTLVFVGNTNQLLIEKDALAYSSPLIQILPSMQKGNSLKLSRSDKAVNLPKK